MLLGNMDISNKIELKKNYDLVQNYDPEMITYFLVVPKLRAFLPKSRGSPTSDKHLLSITLILTPIAVQLTIGMIKDMEE